MGEEACNLLLMCVHFKKGKVVSNELIIKDYAQCRPFHEGQERVSVGLLEKGRRDWT